MARMALEYGTTDIVATPHANEEFAYEPQVVTHSIHELQRAVGDGIKIHRGCDFHLSPRNIQMALREPSRFSINGLRYLLVEFPDATLFHGIEAVFDNLASAGLTPIVTHPERNMHLASDIPRLRRWVEKGIPLQITAQSLLGNFGSDLERWCLQMLGDGYVHFVASDAHDLTRRPPRLDQSRDFLIDQFDEECAELLLEVHPRAAIEGWPLALNRLVPRRRVRRKWFVLGASRRT